MGSLICVACWNLIDTCQSVVCLFMFAGAFSSFGVRGIFSVLEMADVQRVGHALKEALSSQEYLGISLTLHDEQRQAIFELLVPNPLS